MFVTIQVGKGPGKLNPGRSGQSYSHKRIRILAENKIYCPS